MVLYFSLAVPPRHVPNPFLVSERAEAVLLHSGYGIYSRAGEAAGHVEGQV